MARNHSVGIGIVGLGFMGVTHFLSARTLGAGRVRAIVTTDPKKARGDFRGVRGNFGAGGGKVDLKGTKVHGSLEALLDDPAVDLVDICLPSYLHAPAAQKALRAGKHVLVEKPVALRPADARRMMSAAKDAGKLLMVAQVLKFFPEFSVIASAVEDERWGKLLALHMRRRISRPDWGAGSWFSDPSKSGGMVVDLHIHDTDFIVNLFGAPESVASQGIVEAGRVDFIRTSYRYAEGKGTGVLVTAEAGWINPPGLAFEHGYDAYFEKAALRFDSSRGKEPILYGSKGGKPLKLKAVDGFREELEAAAGAVRGLDVPSRLSAESASASLAVCLAEERSARTGRPVAL